MAEFTEKTLNRVVTILFDANSQVTHAFQVRKIQGFVDGVEYGSPQDGNHENIEPADIATAVPAAAVLAQLTSLKAQASSDAGKAASALAAEVEAHAATKALLDAATAAIAEAQGHASALVAAIAPKA